MELSELNSPVYKYATYWQQIELREIGKPLNSQVPWFRVLQIYIPHSSI